MISVKVNSGTDVPIRLPSNKTQSVHVVERTDVDVNIPTQQEVDINTPDYNVIIEDTCDPYVGTYNVEPKVARNVVLQTASKKMTDNVTVQKVPSWEVSNTTGKTFIIGGI